MSEKTKEELEAEIKALEGDIKKQQDKDTWLIRAIWRVTSGVTSGLVKLTWGILKIPLGLTWAAAKKRTEEKQRIRQRIREKSQQDQARHTKLAELKKQLAASEK